MPIYRGIRVGIEPNGGTVYVEFNSRVLPLKTANGREIIDGQYKNELSPETVFGLARLAVADTVDIVNPTDCDTFWGFVTEDSPHFNDQNIKE